jgi:molybdate transport system regulatory protein
MPRPVIRFRIDFSAQSNVGPGKIGLLEAISASGSLSQAARAMGMSYRRAWLLLESLNTSFQDPPTVATRGGKGGGGVQLTPFGDELVKTYRALEAQITRESERHLRNVTAKVSTGQPERPTPGRRALARTVTRTKRGRRQPRDS